MRFGTLSGERLNELLRYVSLSALSAFVTIVCPILLHEVAGVREEAAVGLSLVAAFILNFVMFRSFVFRSTGRAPRQFVRYLVFSLSFRVLEYLGFLLLFRVFSILYSASIVIVFVVSYVVKYICWKYVVFRPADTDSSIRQRAEE